MRQPLWLWAAVEPWIPVDTLLRARLPRALLRARGVVRSLAAPSNIRWKPAMALY